jgi:hypothetical protein
MYPTLKLFRAHRENDYDTIEKYIGKIPNSFVQNRIPLLIIYARFKMTKGMYREAQQVFEDVLGRIADNKILNIDEKAYLSNYVKKGLKYCLNHLEPKTNSKISYEIESYNKKNIKPFILNNFLD